MHWIQSQIKQKDSLMSYSAHSLLSSSSSSSSLPYNSDYQKQSTPPPPPPSSSSKISPAILFVVVIIAVIFFVSGLLHLLVRFLGKHRSSSTVSESNRYPEMSGSASFQRQLQQLFHLHDSGLDQAFIDALPVFLYKEIVGLKEPFDCAVCLCEFSEQDNLRLLPMCSHAFHIDCIDTWLLSNSTCPLCRGSLHIIPGFGIENPVFDFEDPREEDRFSGNGGSGVCQKPAENEIISEKRVFSIRLGKFKSSNSGVEGRGGVEGNNGGGETSSSNLDARRCFSLGSYQYVVADSELQVALYPSRTIGGSQRIVKGQLTARHGSHQVSGGSDVRILTPIFKRSDVKNENSSNDGEVEGKNINIRSKGESFSVSKIWQWSKKGKDPIPSETHMSSSYSVTLGLADATTTHNT